MAYITQFVTREDIDLIDKLSNMVCSEISEEIYDKCNEEKTFKKIEDKVWKLMRNSASKFSKASYYEELAKEYDPVDEHDMWSACLYNCDLLYMTAIAHVLKLPTPRTAGDIEIFGM